MSKIFIKDLYSEREGEDNRRVTQVIPMYLLERFLKIIIKYYDVCFTTSFPSQEKHINLTKNFLQRLYFHLKDEHPAEKALYSGEYKEYEDFCKYTNISKFFESIEIFCRCLFEVDSYILRQGNSDSDNLNSFIENLNDLFIRGNIPYKLNLNSEGIAKITKISESRFIQKELKKFIELTSNEKFIHCQDKFIEAENCFAKRKFDNVLIKCNSVLETLLSIILKKGSGKLNKLYDEFSKKYKLPSVYENAIPNLSKLIEEVQNARSRYHEDAHGKNPEINKEDPKEIIEEITELVLNQTASYAVFIIKTYEKIKIR